MAASPVAPNRSAAFLDRDGVINVDHGYVYRPTDFVFVPGALDGARLLHEMGFLLVVVTNQSGIGRGLYSTAEFHALSEWMKAQFRTAHAPLAGVYHCPHHPAEALGDYRRDCGCRKPQPGMLLAAASDLALDLTRSVLFGDKDSDLMAARTAEVPLRVLLGTDGVQVPHMPQERTLATHVYRSLSDALTDSTLLSALRTQLHTRSAVA